MTRPSRPDFIVIGAQKAATTSLFEYLRRHPEIFLPDFKETNFFIEEGTWRRGIEWYESLYADAAGRGVPRTGDISPGYTMFPIFAGAPERIASVVPLAKLVYLVREPVARMRSHYFQQLSDGFERRPAREALLRDIQYLSLSLYALQLDQYLAHFPRSQILVLRAEDLAARPQQTLDRLLTFLELDPGWVPPNLGQVYNPSAVKRAPRRPVAALEAALQRFGRGLAVVRVRNLAARSAVLSRPITPAETRLDDDLVDRLRRCLAPDVARLRDLIGAEFDGWDAA